MVATDSNSLTARQRARKAMEDRRNELKRRETAITDVFASIDELDALRVKVGTALRELVTLGETNTSAGELVGLSARDVSVYIRAAKEAANSGGSESSNEQTSRDTEDGVTAPAEQSS